MTDVSPTSALGLIQQDENPSRAELDAQKLADDFDDFLLLLTTQLENQDPTEPLDTNEFTQQLVMFASVEQQVATNSNIEQLVEATVASGVQQSLGYIGKAIEAVGDKGVLADGQAVFAYELPQTATRVDVSILNSGGQVVFSGAGSTDAGRNTVLWDGINSFNSQQMPDGTYQIVVSARGTGDSELDVTTFTTGRVTSAEVDAEGQTLLTVGTTKVPVSDVRAVREITTAPNVVDEVAANDNTGDEESSSDDTELSG